MHQKIPILMKMGVLISGLLLNAGGGSNTIASKDKAIELATINSEYPATLISNTYSQVSTEQGKLNNIPSQTCIIKGLEAPAGVCDLEEGLYVVGEFEKSRPTIVYIHGWIPSYEIGVPDFVNAEGWQQAGFNTVIFRFIEDAFDLGEGETCDIIKDNVSILNPATTSCPRYAEQRVWEKGGISDRFVENYREFFADYPDYQKEVRFVGHSLGAQLVAATAFAIHNEPSIESKPARVELIDPYIGNSAFGTGNITVTPSDYYPFELVPGTKCQDNEIMTSYCAVENSLLSIKNKGVGVAVYGSVSSAFFGYDLRNNFHYQEYHHDWLCGKDLFSDRFQCLNPTFSYSDATAKHFFPLFSYFWSIDETLPKNGISAKTPTTGLVFTKSYRKQKPNENWCNLENGVLFWKQEGLDHVFGISRYAGEIGRGYQDTTDNMEDFTSRLVNFLEFSRANAQQCALAISFSNDEYQVMSPEKSAEEERLQPSKILEQLWQ